MLEDKRISLAGAGSSKVVFRLIWQWVENSQNLIVVTLDVVEFSEWNKHS
jgi:hypothetical protein